MDLTIFVGFLAVWFCSGHAEFVHIQFKNFHTNERRSNLIAGDSVVLKCEIPEGATNVYIVKESYPIRQILFVENQLPEILPSDKYRLRMATLDDGLAVELTICNLTFDDAALYSCHFCNQLNQERLVCSFSYIFLRVLVDLDNSTAQVFCDLISGRNGTFFVGEELVLICSKENIQILLDERKLNDPKVEKIDNLYLYTIKNVDERFNGTILRCTEKGVLDTHNYCKGLPRLHVFNAHNVEIIADHEGKSLGENITFTCQSNIFMLSSVEWNLLEKTERVIFDDFSATATPSGSQLTINHVNYGNFSDKPFRVVCNITIASHSVTREVTIYKKLDEVIPQMSQMSINHVVTVGAKSPGAGARMAESSASVAAVVVPIAVVFMLILVVLHRESKTTFYSQP